MNGWWNVNVLELSLLLIDTILFLVLRNVMFSPVSVVHGSFYQNHTSRNYFTETHEQERGNQADTGFSKSLMDVSYKIKVLLWTISLLSLSVTLWNLGRGTKRKKKEGFEVCFAGLELFNKNDIDRKPSKGTIQVSPDVQPSQHYWFLETLRFYSLQCI